MGIDTESSKKYEEQWWQDRFKHLSPEELEKTEREDRERTEAQEEIERIVQDAANDPESNTWTKEKVEEYEKKKAERIKKIYED